MDYVKNSLVVDSTDFAFIYIKFNYELKSEIVFLNNVKYQMPNNFWVDTDLMYKNLLTFDLFNKLEKVNFEYNLNHLI